MLIFIPYIQHCTKVLERTIRQKKRNKWYIILKGSLKTISSHRWHDCIYKNPKDLPQKSTRANKKFKQSCKIQNHQTKKSVAFSCIGNQQPKNEISIAILFKVTLKIIACLGISLTKEV